MAQKVARDAKTLKRLARTRSFGFYTTYIFFHLIFTNPLYRNVGDKMSKSELHERCVTYKTFLQAHLEVDTPCEQMLYFAISIKRVKRCEKKDIGSKNAQIEKEVLLLSNLL